MAEALFYHLDGRTLEAVLPVLLEKSVERGWRVVVQAGSAERLAVLDTHLWTYADPSFLAHGTAADGHAADQPVFLTTGADNPNGATVRFLVDRAGPPEDVERYERLVIVFDGRDEAALAEARDHWKALKARGLEMTYWQQSGPNGWQRKG